MANPAGSAPVNVNCTPAIFARPFSVTSPRNSIPRPLFDTLPRMLPPRSTARMPVLPAGLKKPPSNPQPNRSVSNHTDNGPFNAGVDRQSVVYGQSGYVRVTLGGRRI